MEKLAIEFVSVAFDQSYQNSTLSSKPMSPEAMFVTRRTEREIALKTTETNRISNDRNSDRNSGTTLYSLVSGKESEFLQSYICC